MNFREELQHEYFQEQLDKIRDDITEYVGRRYYKVLLEQDIDFRCKWLFSYQLIGYGQLVWDELIALGFKPQFTWGGECAGGPGIYIRW